MRSKERNWRKVDLILRNARSRKLLLNIWIVAIFQNILPLSFLTEFLYRVPIGIRIRWGIINCSFLPRLPFWWWRRCPIPILPISIIALLLLITILNFWHITYHSCHFTQTDWTYQFIPTRKHINNNQLIINWSLNICTSRAQSAHDLICLDLDETQRWYFWHRQDIIKLRGVQGLNHQFKNGFFRREGNH